MLYYQNKSVSSDQCLVARTAHTCKESFKYHLHLQVYHTCIVQKCYRCFKHYKIVHLDITNDGYYVRQNQIQISGNKYKE